MSTTTTWRNWGGTVQARPERVVVPADSAEVAAAVRAAARDGLRVKAVGAGHSFSAIAGRARSRHLVGATRLLRTQEAVDRVEAQHRAPLG